MSTPLESGSVKYGFEWEFFTGTKKPIWDCTIKGCMAGMVEQTGESEFVGRYPKDEGMMIFTEPFNTLREAQEAVEQANSSLLHLIE